MDHEVAPAVAAAPPAPKYEDLAELTEHWMLDPAFTETQIREGVEAAKRYQVAAVVVRPSDVDLALNWVKGSPVVLGSVVDWPDGFETTSVKNFAARDLLRRGVKQVDTVMNTGKLVSRQFQYLEMELVQMADACHQSGAVLAVHLASAHLNEELKIVACRICRRAGADFIAGEDADMPLLKEYSKERLRLKGARVAGLDQALALRTAGCERIAAADSGPLLDAWRERLASLATEAQKAPVIS